MNGRKCSMLMVAAVFLAACVIPAGGTEDPVAEEATTIEPTLDEATVKAEATTEEAAAGEMTRERPAPLMHQKLDAMHGALEGITRRDFRQIREAGDMLQRISVIDQWLKYPNTQYGQMTEDFRRGVENMIMAADVDNLEGATLYYQKITMSCLECHTFMRDPRHM